MLSHKLDFTYILLRDYARFGKSNHIYTCDRILENLPSTHETNNIITNISRHTLVKQPDISVRDTLNYQKNWRNNFDWVVSLTYKEAKLYILIISFVCRW